MPDLVDDFRRAMQSFKDYAPDAQPLHVYLYPCQIGWWDLVCALKSDPNLVVHAIDMMEELDDTLLRE